MDAGYFSLRDAHAAGWPLVPWQWGLESLSPWHGVWVPLQPDLPVLRSVPRLCFCNGRFVVPLPLLWGCFCGGLPGHPHAGGLPGVCPLPSGPLLCSGSVHVLGTVSDQTHFACLGFGRLRYGTQSSRGGKFYKLQVVHIPLATEPPCTTRATENVLRVPGKQT